MRRATETGNREPIYIMRVKENMMVMIIIIIYF